MSRIDIMCELALGFGHRVIEYLSIDDLRLAYALGYIDFDEMNLLGEQVMELEDRL